MGKKSRKNKHLIKAKPREGLNSKLIIPLILLVFAGLALFIRIIPCYHQIFTSSGIKFSGNDAYYQMRIADIIARNFPHAGTFDPYFQYPDGTIIGNIHLFSWLIGFISWLLGFGHPSQHLIDVVGAYFPAVLGALVVLPIYFIGKSLFGKWAGLIATGLVAIMPGEFLGRSMLGYTDQHVLETLLIAVTMMLLVMGLSDIGKRKRVVFGKRKRVVYGILAGLCLGLYIFTWVGAALFVFIITLYFVVQLATNHLKHKISNYLMWVGMPLFSVALAMSLWCSMAWLTILALSVGLIAILFLFASSRIMEACRVKGLWYPLAIVVIGLIGGVGMKLASPQLFTAVTSAFGVFVPSQTMRTTLEAEPLFFPNGKFSLMLMWGNFTTGFFLSLVALGILIYGIVKRGESNKTLLVVWSLVILAATIEQRRFAYYFAVNVAILVGYLSWKLFEWAGVGKEFVASKKRRQDCSSGVTVGLIGVVVFFVAFFWNIQPAVVTASQVSFVPDDAWCESLSWMKGNTPDPLGNVYYKPVMKDYSYLPSAYGVLSWWDYGYWISRMAHRIPNANPSQDPAIVQSVADYFTSQDGQPIAGTKYVIVDWQMVTGKYWAMATWAGKGQSEFFGAYWSATQQSYIVYLYPEYYQSMAVRLYNFDGKSTAETNPRVISYRTVGNPNGTSYTEVLSEMKFDTYQEAEAYIASQSSGDYRIVGVDPLASPMPLEELGDYRLVYSSGGQASISNLRQIPAVKIFELK